MDVVVSKQGSEHVCVCRPLVRSNVKRRSSQQLFLLFLAFCFSPALAVNLVFLRRPACLLPQLLESRLPSFTSFFKANWAIQNESSRLLLFPSGSTRFYLSLDLRGGAYSQTGRTEPITGLRDTKQKTEKQVFRVPFGWHQLHRIFKHNFSVPVVIQRNFSDPIEDCTK